MQHREDLFGERARNVTLRFRYEVESVSICKHESLSHLTLHRCRLIALTLIPTSPCGALKEA